MEARGLKPSSHRSVMSAHETLVGREDEQAHITALIDRSAQGESATLVIRGEPGVGKTALLDHASTKALGTVVLEARGVESESELPFAALSELLRPLIHLLDSIPTPQNDALAAAMGLAPPTAGDPLTTAVATLTLLAQAAEAEPVLALVDDVHWLDASSLNILSFVARRLAAEGVVVFFAVRDVPAQLRMARLPELALGPLAPRAARELALRARPMATQAVDAVLRTAQGNPLALLQLPGLLNEDEAAGRAAARSATSERDPR
jgi:predicted ATPase